MEENNSPLPAAATASPAGTVAAAPSEKPTDETIKETFEAIIIAFILAFVFRAYVVEAFVIPTGSMAPTLLGEHVNIVCPQCGYHFNVNSPIPPGASQALCPMCHFPISMKGLSVSAGDRILVHKFLYTISEPRRWDVVVFKNPYDPRINYIKRLVGLPNESLWVIDGNLFVKSQTNNADWHIARKSDRPRVQRDVWQPIYHSQYIPLDRGSSGIDRVEHEWHVPWRAVKGNWSLAQRRSYEHLGGGHGEIAFDFPAAHVGPHWYAYNQFERREADKVDHEPIEDVRIAASVQPSGSGASVKFHTTARLDSLPQEDAVSRLTGSIDATGKVTLEASRLDGGQSRQLGTAQVTPLAAGVSRHVELWYVDQQASLWIDDQRVIVANFDIDIATATGRAPAPQYPEISIEVDGPSVTLHGVEVDRDIYYSSVQYGNPTNHGQGVFVRNRASESPPVNLESDQFFCMGDNSPLSHDSRFWQSVNPWIEKRMFDEEVPPHIQKFGIVPRKLMMGRAFFVYFPAPYPLAPGGSAVLPNFGDMRFIH